jgi:Domain of unknown function (DUF4350)
MRGYLGILVCAVVVLAVIVGLSTAGTVQFDKPPETESNPVRSSYNAGPTGTKALYQFLEESGASVNHWRESYQTLERRNQNGILIVIGPFPDQNQVPDAESEALKGWIAQGGHAIIISRTPRAQFDDPRIAPRSTDHPSIDDQDIVDDNNQSLLSQPTELIRGLHGLVLSKLAERMRFNSPRPPGQSSSTVPERVIEGPVVHIGDEAGAVLADFDLVKGRVLFLSDPFVVSNSGIGRGSNLRLALNMLHVLGAPKKPILFDEFHHGYQSETNPLLAYLHGTPVVWIIGQALLLVAAIFFSRGKRYGRPLPLPTVDRHSPLEFVSSMANLEQVSRARDLAVENIYPRFKSRMARLLGLRLRSSPNEFAAAVARRRTSVSPDEMRRTIEESEAILAGHAVDDHRLVDLVARMRRIASRLQ